MNITADENKGGRYLSEHMMYRIEPFFYAFHFLIVRLKIMLHCLNFQGQTKLSLYQKLQIFVDINFEKYLTHPLHSHFFYKFTNHKAPYFCNASSFMRETLG